MSKLPTYFFGAGAIFALIGMAWGIEMSVTQDHSMFPAHAHLNLIGFVVMSIFGTFYALSPGAASSRLAWVHFWLTVAAVVIMIPGIVLALLESTEALAKIGSILALLSMAMFVFVVVRHGVGSSDTPGSRSPAK